MLFFLFGLIICFMEAVMAHFNPNNTQVYRVSEDCFHHLVGVKSDSSVSLCPFFSKIKDQNGRRA